MRCEIDAHGLCAEDHLPYQGRQYSLRNYERLNSYLKRPIGTCNCRHGISYIILGVSPKMGPECEIWSHFTDFGLILFLKGEMLKSPKWKKWDFSPISVPQLSPC